MVSCPAWIQRRPSIGFGLSKYLIDSFEIDVGLRDEPVEQLIESLFSIRIVTITVLLFELDEHFFSGGPLLAKP